MEETNSSSDSDFVEFEQEAEKWLAEFKNRKIYDELNAQIITNIPNADLPQAIVDYIGYRINQDWENDLVKVPALGPGFSAIYFLIGLQIEVNNGGFNQLFYNRGREAVVRAKQGAALLGLSTLAGVIANALEIADQEKAKMAEVKEVGTLEAFFESYDSICFDAADEGFTNLGLDLDAAMAAFIRGNVHLFVGGAK